MLQKPFCAIDLATLEDRPDRLFRQDDAASRFGIIGHWPLRASG